MTKSFTKLAYFFSSLLQKSILDDAIFEKPLKNSFVILGTYV